MEKIVYGKKLYVFNVFCDNCMYFSEIKGLELSADFGTLGFQSKWMELIFWVRPEKWHSNGSFKFACEIIIVSIVNVPDALICLHVMNKYAQWGYISRDASSIIGPSREKYLSKRSLIKHACSWCDVHIMLRTLNRQAKILLRVFICFLAKEFVISRTIASNVNNARI